MVEDHSLQMLSFYLIEQFENLFALINHGFNSSDGLTFLILLQLVPATPSVVCCELLKAASYHDCPWLLHFLLSCAYLLLNLHARMNLRHLGYSLCWWLPDLWWLCFRCLLLVLVNLDHQLPFVEAASDTLLFFLGYHQQLKIVPHNIMSELKVLGILPARLESCKDALHAIRHELLNCFILVYFFLPDLQGLALSRLDTPPE